MEEQVDSDHQTSLCVQDRSVGGNEAHNADRQEATADGDDTAKIDSSTTKVS